MEYAVVKYTDSPVTRNSVKKRWSSLPTALTLPTGRRLVSPVDETHVGIEYEEFRFVELVFVDDQAPSKLHRKDTLSADLTTTRLTVTQTWIAPTQQEIDDLKVLRRQQDIDGYLRRDTTEIQFQIQKQNDPTITKAQFAAFVNNKWPAA